jgi:hypothetical protein
MDRLSAHPDSKMIGEPERVVPLSKRYSLSQEAAFSTSLTGLGLVMVALLRLGRFAMEDRAVPNRVIGAWMTLAFTGIFVVRLPSILLPFELQVDESFLLIQARRCLEFPVPWVQVDGTTSGPLNYQVLAAALGLGAPYSWCTPRILFTLLVLFWSWGSYYIARELTSDRSALAASLPLFLFFATPVHHDFRHFASETVGLTLLLAAFTLLANSWRQQRADSIRFGIVGVFLGAAPLAKLQLLPLAIWAIFLAGVLLLRLKWIQAPEIRTSGFRLTAFSAGLSFVPALFLFQMVASGGWEDAWISYYETPRSLVDPANLSRLHSAFVLLFQNQDFSPYLKATILGISAAALCRFRLTRGWPSGTTTALMLAGCTLAVAVFCALLSGRPWLHYLLIVAPFVPPFCATILEWLRFSKAQSSAPIVIAFMLIALGGQARRIPLALNIAGFEMAWSQNKRHDVSELLRQISVPGDQVAVWGWMPECLIESCTVSGTRDANTSFMFLKSPYQAYFWDRFRRDLATYQPRFLVNAVADGAFNLEIMPSISFDTIPTLRDYVRDNYRLAHEVRLSSSGKPVQIYIRNSRVQ